MDRSTARKLIAQAISDGLRPPKLWNIVEWAERHIALDSRSSGTLGDWRVCNSPYVAEILEALSPDSPVTDVAVMKGSQLGITLMAHIWMGFLISEHPSNIFSCMPTVEDAKDASKQKWRPLVDLSEPLRERIAPPRSRDSGNTIMVQEFPGGSLIWAGANSPARFRSRSGRYVLADEIDAYPKTIATGDPIALIERFTSTYRNRKHLWISTPTDELTSSIAKKFRAGDQSRLYVPCPRCGEQQLLIFRDVKTGRKGLRWEGVLPDLDVWYECEKCHGRIDESEKDWMLERHVWRPTVPRLSESYRSFHVSSLYSPPGQLSWSRIAARYVNEGNGQNALKLRVFINEVLGETWEDRGESPEWEDLFSRRELYAIGTVPKGVHVLTAGADVQKDRIEVEVVGWGPRLESWSIDYIVIQGDTSADATWRKLDDLLVRPYRRAGGGELRIRLLAVDTGWDTMRVYNWVRGKPPGSVIAVDGRATQPTLVTGHPKYMDVRRAGGVIRRGVQLWGVGTNLAKRELFTFLRVRPVNRPGEPVPTGLCHWPQYPQDYFEQLTNERLVTKKKHGFTQFVWEKTGRNEALDCRVYARAASAIVGIDRWNEHDWARAIGGAAPAQLRGNAKGSAPRTGRYGGLGDMSRWHSRRPT